jgi:hypothetical protein
VPEAIKAVQGRHAVFTAEGPALDRLRPGLAALGLHELTVLPI